MIAEKVGWGLSIIGTALWGYGYFIHGLPPLVDWQAFTPAWVADFLPNRQAEAGFALMIVGSIPVYWAMWKTAAAQAKDERNPADR